MPARHRWQQQVKDRHSTYTLILEFEFCYASNRILRSWSVTQVLEPTPYAPVHYTDLNPEATLSIEYTYPNLFKVQGNIWLIPLDAQLAVYTDALSYGFELDPLHHFEGVMFEIPGVELVHPVPPVHPVHPVHPPPPGPSLVPDIEPSSGPDGELFPYVYMRIWPEPDPADVAKRFVSYPYPPDAPPSGSFLRELVALRSSGQPGSCAAMRALAVAYIEGKTGNDAPYVPSLHDRSGGQPDHAAIHRLLCASQERPAEAVIEDIHQALGMDAAELARYVRENRRDTMLVRRWQSWIALVIELGYAAGHRDALACVLVIEHLLAWLVARQGQPVTPSDLAELAHASVVLPSAVFPLPTAEGSVPPASPPLPDPSETITPYAIGDLQMVKQTLRGYRLGELAYVENVQAGERRESSRKQRSRTVETTTTRRLSDDASTSTSQSTLASLTREALESCAVSTSDVAYNNFTSNYGPPTAVTLDGGWTTTETPGLKKRDTTRFARDVLDRAVSRHASRVLESREFSAMREAEESVSSIIDNSRGEHHRCAVYRWLDEVYWAYVVNYGNRMILEFIVEDPAAAYIGAVESPASSALLAPIPPASVGIESYEDIRPDNLPRLLALYPSPNAALPPTGQVIALTLQSGGEHTVTLPEGQRAVTARLGWALSPAQTSIQIQGVIGPAAFDITAGTAGVKSIPLLPTAPPGSRPEVGSISIIIESSLPLSSPPEQPTAPAFSVEIETEPSAHAMARWQLDTYQAITRSYEAQSRASAAAATPDADAPQSIDPRHSNREIERYTLKYDSFELLFERLAVTTGTSERPSRGRPPSELELARPRYLRFFETAFEWDEMSYTFFGAKRDRPAVAALSARTANDLRFRRFIDASYASVLVPIAPEHAPAVLFFLDSGMLWDGPPRWTAVYERDIPLVSDLKAVASGPPRTIQKSEPWTVVVPTGVAVLADPSALSGLALIDSVAGKPGAATR